MRLLAWCSLLVAACGGHTPTPTPAVGNAATPEPTAQADDDFRGLARDLAKQTGRFIEGWGTTRLDGERFVRFATLTKNDQDRGDYLLELGPGRLVVVDYYVDGRTTVYGRTGDGVPAATDPPWQDGLGGEIAHEQGHHHGYESFGIGLRGGELVITRYTLLNDSTDPDPTIDRDQDFRRDDPGCAACPPVAGFQAMEADLKVIGPAATVAELAAAVNR